MSNQMNDAPSATRTICTFPFSSLKANKDKEKFLRWATRWTMLLHQPQIHSPISVSQFFCFFFPLLSLPIIILAHYNCSKFHQPHLLFSPLSLSLQPVSSTQSQPPFRSMLINYLIFEQVHGLYFPFWIFVDQSRAKVPFKSSVDNKVPIITIFKLRSVTVVSSNIFWIKFLAGMEMMQNKERSKVLVLHCPLYHAS